MFEQSIAFVGSRKASKHMIAVVQQYVKRAAARGWHIHVGDNPKGVDMAVIECAQQIGASYSIWGVGDNNRALGIEVDRPSLSDYTNRDRLMIDMSDRVVLFWNGSSPGTRNAYEYAQHAGKPGWLVQFKGQLHTVTELNLESVP